MVFDGAKWIWIRSCAQAEEYVSFEKNVPYSGKGCLKICICAEMNYIAYLNGQRVGFGQFPNHENEKYYDEIDITPFANKGENTLRITVRYEGCSSFTHIDDGAGLIFAVSENGKTVAVSDASTLACYDARYVQHVPRKINFALGYACDMRSVPEPDRKTPCVEQTRACRLSPRPVRLLELTETYEAKLCDRDKDIYDIGIECAGYLFLKLRCAEACTVTVAYGEHLADDAVRQKVGDYDFSLRFHCKAGENVFENFFVRLGCRYLQVKSDNNVK